MQQLFNHVRTVIRDIHIGTVFISPVFGGIVGANTVTEKFASQKNVGLIDHILLCVPETTAGAVCGMFWVYTLIPYSLFKRYQFSKNQEK